MQVYSNIGSDKGVYEFRIKAKSISTYFEANREQIWYVNITDNAIQASINLGAPYFLNPPPSQFKIETG